MAIMEAIELYRLDIFVPPYCIIFAKELLYLLKRFLTGNAGRGRKKNAFQGETDFAGRKSAAGRGAKKDIKREKTKRKARGVIGSSRRGGRF